MVFPPEALARRAGSVRLAPRPGSKGRAAQGGSGFDLENDHRPQGRSHREVLERSLVEIGSVETSAGFVEPACGRVFPTSERVQLHQSQRPGVARALHAEEQRQ